MKVRPNLGRKIPCKQIEVRGVPYATAGPDRDHSPMAPPPNSPNPCQEERAPEPSDPTADSRWAHPARVACVIVKMVLRGWNMLPHELQSWLINRMHG
jgi:hypothetical protein